MCLAPQHPPHPLTDLPPSVSSSLRMDFIHIRGDVQPSDVQDGGGQVDAEDDVGIPEGGEGEGPRSPGQ